MSILKSTRAGYKYHYAKEILQNCCEFTLNGNSVEFDASLNDDGSIDVRPIGIIKFALYSKMFQRNRNINYPESWFTKGPYEMFHFVGVKDFYNLHIKKPFNKEFRFNNITSGVVIECEIPEIEKYFKQTKIEGNVSVAKELQKIYDEKFLIEHMIQPYFGKDYMGF